MHVCFVHGNGKQIDVLYCVTYSSEHAFKSVSWYVPDSAMWQYSEFARE